MRRALAALALAVALPLPSLAPAPVHAQVVVRPGETLSEIAERHGVGLNRLMQANGISNPDHVEVGQSLVIPGGSGRSTAAAAAGHGGSVTVQPGETLSGIAEREGVSMTRLMQANGLGNADLVMVGERLVIPGRASAAPAPAARATPTAPYTVKSGETLSDIAARFDTTPERLIQINGLSNPDLLLAGSRLRIPARPGAAAAAAGSAKAREHVVSSGESLGSIAERYGTSVERLVALNSVDNPDLLHAGTKLRLVGTPPARPTAVKPKATQEPTPTPTPAPKPAPQPAAKATLSATSQPAASPAAAAATPKRQPEPKPEPQPQAATAVPAAKTAPEITPEAATPQPVAEPRPAAETAAETQAQPPAKTKTETKPEPEPAPSRLTLATRGVSQSSLRPSAGATGGGAVTTVASRSVSATTTAPSKPTTAQASAKDGDHDWRSYGPLQVDWANWQPMGGSYVAPTLNSDGEPLYLAINCGARKVNATGQSGQWKTWDDPERDYEQKLVSDLCKAKGG